MNRIIEIINTKIFKEFAVTIIVLSVLAGVIVYSSKEKIIENQVKKILQTPSSLDSLEDGLHVILLGTGSPMPDVLRAGVSTVVIAGKHVYVVDAG